MQNISLNGNQLKIIAITAMLIDHIGAVFYPDLAILRAIGRLTMPIMAYFIAEGYHYTQDLNRYMLRLLAFGIITMVPYSLYFGFGPFNVMFSLLAGLIAITLYDRYESSTKKMLAVFLPMLVATFLGFDGQFIVVFLVFIFHRYRGQFQMAAIHMLLLYAMVEAMFVMSNITGDGPVGFHMWIQLFALLTLPLLYKYNGTKGKPELPKYTFYIFYPLHISLLLLVKLYI